MLVNRGLVLAALVADVQLRAGSVASLSDLASTASRLADLGEADISAGLADTVGEWVQDDARVLAESLFRLVDFLKGGDDDGLGLPGWPCGLCSDSSCGGCLYVGSVRA